MLPPSQFQIEKPPCIRAAMMEYAVSEINSDFGKKINEILDEFTREAKVDRPTAFIMAKKQVDKQTQPYIEAAQRIMEPLRTTLYNAQELERKGQVDGATTLYEKLTEAGFTGSMPYERLRIIYTKQKQYEKAIAACQSFIATLNMLQSFAPRPQYIKLIEEYKLYIDKLNLRAGTTLEGKIVS
jgi:hypothetical protein